MIDDILSEEMVTLTAAAKLIPGRPHISTIWRWRKQGCRGIRLETAVVGGRPYTSREAIVRFIKATTEACDGVIADRTPSHRRQKQIEAAEKELDAAGI
jgi:uncharacterized protein DUF1580